jgi:hypothetical protein
MPSLLFHYQPFNESYLRSLLTDGRIKFSSPDSFNDPWDCRVRYHIPSTEEEKRSYFDWVTQQHRKYYPEIDETERAVRAFAYKSNPAFEDILRKQEQELYVEICKRYRIYCLSEHADSPLMWAHYAASHTGLCLGFDPNSPPFSSDSGVTKVMYHSTYPAHNLLGAGHEVLLIKSFDWSYEDEWRLIAEERSIANDYGTIKTDNGFLNLPLHCLKTIIIGCRVNESTSKRIVHMVKSHRNDVILRQAMPSRDRYTIEITPPLS